MPVPRATRLWAGVSALLATVGVSAFVLLPDDAAPGARLDAPAVVAPPVPPGSGRPVARAVTGSGAVPVRVQIPALGVSSQVIELGLGGDGSMEVPRGAYPVGWYGGSAAPGEPGAAVLVGHVDWNGDRGAFFGLRELRPGDAVVVDRADGTAATFRVDRVEEHAKDDFPTERVYGDIDHAGLRLITCGGAFDDNLRSYQDNIIVFASLVAHG